MTDSERDLGDRLASARAGSLDALGQALQTCRNYLLQIASQELDSDLRAKGGASDLVQETFLEAQRDFACFRGNSSAELLGWLRQILVNNVANFTRRYLAGKRDLGREVSLADADSERSEPGLADSGLTPSTQAVEREQAESMWLALAQLPDDYRQVLILRFQEGRSFDEIGVLMNRTPQAARKLWSRAMDRLRQQWEIRHDSQ